MPEESADQGQAAESTLRAPDGWTHDNWLAYTQLYVDALVAGFVGLLVFTAGFAKAYNGLVVAAVEADGAAGFVITEIAAADIVVGSALSLTAFILLTPALDRFVEIQVAQDLRQRPSYDFRGEFFDD